MVPPRGSPFLLLFFLFLLKEEEPGGVTPYLRKISCTSAAPSSNSFRFCSRSARLVKKERVVRSVASPDAPASTRRPRVGRATLKECRWLRLLLCGKTSVRLPGQRWCALSPWNVVRNFHHLLPVGCAGCLLCPWAFTPPSYPITTVARRSSACVAATSGAGAPSATWRHQRRVRRPCRPLRSFCAGHLKTRATL